MAASVPIIQTIVALQFLGLTSISFLVVLEIWFYLCTCNAKTFILNVISSMKYLSESRVFHHVAGIGNKVDKAEYNVCLVKFKA